MHRSTLTAQRLAALFLAGFLLLYSPVVTLFDRPLSWFGVPLLYFYLFGSWAIIIAVTAWIVRGRDE